MVTQKNLMMIHAICPPSAPTPGVVIPTLFVKQTLLGKLGSQHVTHPGYAKVIFPLIHPNFRITGVNKIFLTLFAAFFGKKCV